MKKLLTTLLVLGMFAIVPSAFAAAKLVPVFNLVTTSGTGIQIVDHYNAKGEFMFRAFTSYLDTDKSRDLSSGDTIIARWAKRGNG